MVQMKILKKMVNVYLIIKLLTITGSPPANTTTNIATGAK
jgi:hypothetical protein